jgi:hypothetical protein
MAGPSSGPVPGGATGSGITRKIRLLYVMATLHVGTEGPLP